MQSPHDSEVEVQGTGCDDSLLSVALPGAKDADLVNPGKLFGLLAKNLEMHACVVVNLLQPAEASEAMNQ